MSHLSRGIGGELGAVFLVGTLFAGSSHAQTEYRTFDGTGNNLAHPEWGSADEALLRLSTPSYGDGVSDPAGKNLRSARMISNRLSAQRGSIPNGRGASSFLWQWGQFLDHDLDLTEGADPAEPFPIAVPLGDRHFDPKAEGGKLIFLSRSAYAPGPGVRQQVNAITAFIDASNVYGSSFERADALRDHTTHGLLRTSPGGFLPFNTNGLPNAPAPSPRFFLAGDVRANEQVGLIAMHTLFVREHNAIATLLHVTMPSLDEEDVFQIARAVVGAEMQVITYREFLPMLLGPGAIAPFAGYRADVNPGVCNIFSTSAYRFGHSLLPHELLRLDELGQPIDEGHLPLKSAFFAPDRVLSEGGIEPILRGLARQPAEEVDALVVNAVRNFLFGDPGKGGFDLAALNIQRGRDHGMPSYNTARVDWGLPPAVTFADIHPDPEVQDRLKRSYGSVDKVEAWAGGLSEEPLPGAMVGELFHRVLVDQFERARDGDRFWYQNHLPPRLVRFVEGQTLASIIRRNTDIDSEIPDNVFEL